MRGDRGIWGTAAATAALALLVVGAGTASADAAERVVVGAKPCPDEATYPWMGNSIAKRVTVPSLTTPAGIEGYEGTILRPTDSAAYPGPRPVVVLQHGNNGDQCRLWWVAQDLAGHGYVALVWTVPNASTQQNFIRSVDATRSALAFVRTGANPYLSSSDPTQIAVAGSSLGAVVTSYVQGDPDPAVRAAVALDNLVPAVPSDGGMGEGEGLCGNAEAAIPVTPRVPALGFAKDEPCGGNLDPFSKQPAFTLWRNAGIPSMEVIMAGFEHTDFMANGSEAQRLDVSHYLLAWLDRWLLDAPDATDRLLADTVNGRPTDVVVSSKFRSASFLPGVVNTTDLIGWLHRDVISPKSKRVAGPERLVTRRQVHGRGLKFRFRADEPDSSFRCRLDDQRWRRCRSPHVLHRAAIGRHTFRVQATDAAGNRERKPASWRFRVQR